MKDSGIFRKINTIETNMITKSLDSISAKISSELDRLKMVLYISVERSTTKKDFPKIYLINNEQVKLIRKIDVKNKIHAAGLYFGFIKKGTFYLSLEGAEYLYGQELLSGIQRLQVNELGEKSILYGNNILKKMVLRSPEKLKKNEFLLIFNEKNEILAIAQSNTNQKSIHELPSKEIVAINLSDKGLYLRKKQ